jgi:hypothetical protein
VQAAVDDVRRIGFYRALVAEGLIQGAGQLDLTGSWSNQEFSLRPLG